MKLVALFLIAAAGLCAQNVTPDRLANALKEQQNWLTYWGDYTGIHHRDLKQVNTANVKNLRVDWIYQTGEAGSNETTPLVVDGVMYLTAVRGSVMAQASRNWCVSGRHKY